MHASLFSQSRQFLRGTLLFCLASATSLTGCFEVREAGVAKQTETTTAATGDGASEEDLVESSGAESSMPDQSSTQDDSAPEPDTSGSQEPTEETGDGTDDSDATTESDDKSDSPDDATTESDEGSSTGDNTGVTTTSTTGTSTTSTTGDAGTSSTDDSSDETTSTDSTGDTTTEEPARDCANIEWGKGDVVERGTAQGYVDQDGDDELETDKTDAGMCELHLSGRKCGLVLFGFDG